MKIIKENNKNYIILKNKKIEIIYNDKCEITKEELENKVFNILNS